MPSQQDHGVPGSIFYKIPLWLDIEDFIEELRRIRVGRVSETTHDAKSPQIDTIIAGLMSWRRYDSFLWRLVKVVGEKTPLWFDLGSRLLRMGQYQNLPTISKTEKSQLSAKYDAVGIDLELSIEGFYVFAQILLDRVSELIQHFFNTRWKGTGSSHVKLAHKFKRLCAALELQNRPQDLGKRINDLEKRVIRFRNEYIQHASEFLPPGLGGSSQEVNIFPGRANVRSENLEKLLLDIEDYISIVIAFMRINKSRSIVP